MKIRVIFHDDKISWDKKWIFLGSSYKNLKTVENKISGPRLKINNILHEVFKKELQDYPHLNLRNQYLGEFCFYILNIDVFYLQLIFSLLQKNPRLTIAN